MDEQPKRDWRFYEKEIFDLFSREFPDAKITLNAFREGRYSKTSRQIDILIEGQIAGISFTTMIDGKFYNSSVDVKDVETFIGMMQDVGAHKGIIITQVGYSSAAIERVFNDPLDIEVDILNFEELEAFQGEYALPFSVPDGVSMIAPFGCVIDARDIRVKDQKAFGGGAPRTLAYVYQRGLDVREAMVRNEFGYVNFWTKIEPVNDLSKYLAHSEKLVREAYGPEVQIECDVGSTRKDVPTAVRTIIAPQIPGVEYSGLVEFMNFILIIVFYSPFALAKKNLRKLESMMRSAIPMSVTKVDGSDDVVDVGPEK